METRSPSVRAAFSRAGGAQALADGLGINVSAVYQWKRIPAERMPQVARITGMTFRELRPDIYLGAEAGADHAHGTTTATAAA